MQLAHLRGQPFGSTFMDHFGLDEFFRVGTSKIAGPSVIKAHFLGPVAMQWVRLGKVKTVCTYRDPRDCVASDRTFMGLDMEKVLNRVRSNYQAIDQYAGCSSVLMVRYEDMMRDTLGQIRRIATHLGIELPEDTLRKIDGATNVQSSLKVCQQLRHRSPDQVSFVADHIVDPATQLHNNHIHSAKTGRWKTEFTPEQGRELTRMFLPWLTKYGYEVEIPRPAYVRELHVDLGDARANTLGSLQGSTNRATSVSL
jgi:hypothetical protein